MKKLKSTDYELLYELIKNPRLSDRQIAKKIGASQPTITRKRRELEEERLLDYTAVPNLKELGFEIMAITFGNRATHPEYAELQIQKAKDFIEKHPNTIFASTGTGLNSDRVIISVHKNYTDYSRFQQEFRQEWGQIMEVVGSFLVSLPTDIVGRNLTFKYLAELMKREQSKN
jgi:DNA-binding Lrp family transcriptional regulator